MEYIVTITTNNSHVRITGSAFASGDYHPGCAVRVAHSNGVARSLSSDSTIEDVRRFLATDAASLPFGTNVTVVNGGEGGYCAECGQALHTRQSERTPTGVLWDGRHYTIEEAKAEAERRGYYIGGMSVAEAVQRGQNQGMALTLTYDEQQPQEQAEAGEEQATTWAYVTTGGRRYTVQEALDFAARQGVRKPDGMTLEQAVDFVRRNHLDYSDLTLISEDEERAYPAAEYEEGEFTLSDEEPEQAEAQEPEQEEVPSPEDQGFRDFMENLVGSAEDAAHRRNMQWRATVVECLLATLGSGKGEDFEKGAAYVAASILGIDADEADLATFVATVTVLHGQA